MERQRKGTKSIGGFNPIKDVDSTKHGIQRRLLWHNSMMWFQSHQRRHLPYSWFENDLEKPWKEKLLIILMMWSTLSVGLCFIQAMINLCYLWWRNCKWTTWIILHWCTPFKRVVFSPVSLYYQRHIGLCGKD